MTPLSRKKNEMPRERVKHGTQFVVPKKVGKGEIPETKVYVPGEDIPEGALIREEPSIDIAWNREAGWVQLGVSAPTDWWERMFEDRVQNVQEVTISIHPDVLSRSEINNLIRTLRRARDAAYGADE